MIPIIFTANETDFSTNGIGRIVDCTECTVTEERNGIYECEFVYPLSGSFYSELSLDRIIKVKPNEMSDDQLFRIYRISKPINGLVKFYCQHISYDLVTNIVRPFKIINASATDAIRGVINNCFYQSRFTAQTTIDSTATIDIHVPTSARECLGGMEGSVLDLYGGEYEFDNFAIKLHEHRGQDTGVTILYGKNLTDVTAESSIENTYTAIFPYAIDEEDDNPVHTISGSNKVINVSGAPSFGEPRTIAVDLTEMFDLEEEDITSAKLVQYANEYLAENNISDIYQNITISFVQLWQTEEYKNIAVLERVGLCDTVTVRYDKLGVDVKAKVIKTVYDALHEKYISIELGDVKSDFADAIRKETKKQIKEESDATKSDMQKAIDNATALITGQEGGNVVINTDSDGKPKEILIMNTDNIQTASKVWRWNLGGLGYSSTGYSGSYGVAVTMDGSIVADYITTGEMSAARITSGLLTDKLGKNFWNLNNGNFSLSQNNAYNSLTHNGDTQGIYMTPVQGQDYNELRINASYIKSGTIDASTVNVTNINASNIKAGIIQDQTNGTAKNYWNLATGEFRLTAGTKVYKDDGTDSGIFYKSNGELRINADYIKTGTLSANLITTGTLKSSNNQTELSLSTGNLKIALTSGETLNLNANGIEFSANNVTRGAFTGNQLFLRSSTPKFIQLDLIQGLLFSDGYNSLRIIPDTNFTKLKMPDIETGDIEADDITANDVELKSLNIPYNSGNRTSIDVGTLSYQGNIMRELQISINGMDYVVLGYQAHLTQTDLDLHQTRYGTHPVALVYYTESSSGYRYFYIAYDLNDNSASSSAIEITSCGIFGHNVKTVNVQINGGSYAVLVEDHDTPFVQSSLAYPNINHIIYSTSGFDDIELHQYLNMFSIEGEIFNYSCYGYRSF